MTAQPLPREPLIELVTDSPARRTRSKAATQTTAKKATAKSTTKSTSKTVAKTATTRQRSATKSVPIVESSLQVKVQTVSPSRTVAVDFGSGDRPLDWQSDRQRALSAIWAESQKLTQDMEKLASIALKIQQLQRPSFEPLPSITRSISKRLPATDPVQPIAQPPSKVVLVTIVEPSVEPSVEPIAKTTAEPQRPSRTSISRLSVRKPIPPYDPSAERSTDPARSPAVAPNYWGGNVQAPIASCSSVTQPQMHRDRLDLPSLPDRPTQPVLHRQSQQQQPRLTLAVQPARIPVDSSIQTHSQHHSQTHSLTKMGIDQHLQRLVPIPTEPMAIVVDGILWTCSSVGVRIILEVCIQVIPALSLPLHFVMLSPALLAAYLAFCVPQSSTPSVYRCLLTTLGFFLGSKL